MDIAEEMKREITSFSQFGVVLISKPLSVLVDFTVTQFTWGLRASNLLFFPQGRYRLMSLSR
jgi:hypothetical protein